MNESSGSTARGDFGSGCGRILRWCDRALPDAHLHGIDVRAASIEWSQKHLRGEFHHGPFDPPTELADDTFDLVVGLSLFSHFTREANVAWLRELVRVCRPGGAGDGIASFAVHSDRRAGQGPRCRRRGP